MAINIPSYMLGSGLFALGLNWWQALLAVIIGDAVLCVPMVLNAHAGAKYGIPFPVVLRAVFGVNGAKLVGACP